MIFKCQNCGGNTIYEPSRKRMYCPHCESLDSENIVREGSMTQCGNCGAPITPGQYASAGRCAHCGSYIIYEERIDGVFEPHMILPFKLNKDMAVERLNQEFHKKTFLPTGFLSRKSLEKLQGIYVPFWLYDYRAHYDFEGEGTKVRVWRQGDTEYTETSYYHIIRQMEADFDKVPVDASFMMDDGEMDLMEPYAYQELEDFDPKYMSGFEGEVYNQSAPELEGRAQVKVRDASESLMQSSLAGYNGIRPGRKNLDLKRNGIRYVLMPVWMYLYQYQGKTWRFHVNGQTGKVTGKTPVSGRKVILYGLTTMFSVSAFFYLIGAILGML